MNVEGQILLWTQASVKLLDVRYEVLGPNGNVLAYRLPASGFLYAARGSAQVALDGVEYHARSYYVVHGGKGASLDIRTGEEWFEYYIIFYRGTVHGPFNSSIRSMLEKGCPFQLPFGFAPEHPLVMLQPVEQMKQQWTSPGRLERFHAKVLFFEFIHRLLAELQGQGGKIRGRDAAGQAIRYIHEHYAEQISLDDLADKLNYSPGYLSALVKKQTGFSLIDYLIHVRIGKAKALLAQTGSPIREIAASLGYADVYYFGRLFKKQTGLSPAKFRNKSKSADGPSNVPDSSIALPRLQPYIDIGLDNHYQYKREGDLSMHRSWKSSMAVTWLLCLTLLLNACSSTPANTGGGGVQPPASQSPGLTEPGGHAPASARGEQLVQSHKFGETLVPANPERIVSLGLEDMTLALDLPLVFATVHGENHYLERKLKEKGVQVAVDSSVKPNYEAVLAAAPDLIIAAEWIEQDTYRELSKIAPTILFSREKWHTDLAELARLTDKQEQAAAVMSANQALVRRAKDAIRNAVGEGATVAFVRTNEKTAYVWFPFPEDAEDRSYIDVLYKDLDLQPDSYIGSLMKNNPDSKWGIELSLEVLPEIRADLLFVTAGFSGGTKEENDQLLNRLSEIEKLNVWQSIPAVKNGRVYKVSAKHWMLTGPHADELKIRDVVKALTP